MRVFTLTFCSLTFDSSLSRAITVPVATAFSVSGFLYWCRTRRALANRFSFTCAFSAGSSASVMILGLPVRFPGALPPHLVAVPRSPSLRQVSREPCDARDLGAILCPVPVQPAHHCPRILIQRQRLRARPAVAQRLTHHSDKLRVRS